jgi:hypothetical protein
MHEQGWKLGPISVLDQYPRTALDAIAAVVNANESGRVLGLVSVTSSGRLRDRLWSALQTQAKRLDRSALHVMVDVAPHPSVESIEQWLPLPDERPLITGAARDRKCAACLDADRAPLVRFVGGNFRPVLPTDDLLIMLDTKDAADNLRFWELCESVEAIGLEEPPQVPHMTSPELNRPMNVRVRFERLLGSVAFQKEIERRLADEWKEPKCDLVLAPATEADIAGFHDLWAAIAPIIATGPLRLYPPHREWTDQDLVARVRSANEILILSVGSVSGGSLQSGLVGVQSLRDNWRFHTQGLVLHARPTGFREWDTLENSFANKLGALWLTYLPERSPLLEEASVLDDIDSETLSDETATLAKVRKELCIGARSSDDVPLFWGAAASDKLTPNAIFGQGLRSPVVYAAVASAMNSRIAKVQRTRPHRAYRFEMPAIARSYYDPLILASVLRWLQPHEIYWGNTPDASERVITEILARAEHASKRALLILSAELGLAAALGKVPDPGAQVVFARVDALLNQTDSPGDLAVLDLVRAVARSSYD